MSSKGKFVSGEEISKQLYVSRNAVWKAINSLRADGFIIDAAQNKGYLLSGGETDDFTRYGILRIRQLLKKSAADADITIKDTVTSTNTLLRISAENGAPSKTVLIANEQTEGRGRHGKSFYSPADTGIYMSVLLRPDFKADKAFFITAGAAVSVVRAIEKVCGIMGLGINISRPKGGFPSEISDIASSLYSEEAAGNELKCALAAEILNNFFDICERMSVEKLTDEYKSYSVVLGKRIRVISSNAEYYATAVDIDKNARLIVRDENGDMHTLSSAEVSVREGQI